MAEIRERLRLEISNARRDSTCSRPFYPPSEISRILTVDAIRACISTIPRLNENERDVHRFALLIHKHCIRIFAILLANRDEAYIAEFLFRRENDSRIPYTENGLYFFASEKILVARRFTDSQKEFDPVILQKGDIHRMVRDGEVLPFLDDSKIGCGAFGTVYKVVLHPTCQELVAENEGELVIARKELKFGGGSKERSILDLVGALQHPHIVEYLGSYTHRAQTNFLFPYVPMDLRAFLEKRPFSDADTIFENAYGLSDALRKIHTFHFKDQHVEISRIGYHHDLRPDNILVQGTTFLIADFGLSELKPDDRTSKTRLKGGSDDYLGPESFDEVELCNGTVGRALDVWAFGCILLELAVFIHGESVEEFRKARKAVITFGNLGITDYAFHLKGGLRPAVEEKLRTLEQDSGNMQVTKFVPLIRRMLDPNTNTRANIEDITRELGLLAIDSKVHSLKQHFQAVSYDNVSRKMDTHKLILLEWVRFRAWHLVFDTTMHIGEKHTLTEMAILRLNRLKNILEDHMNLPEEEENQSPAESLKGSQDIRLAVESLCETVPTKYEQALDETWTRLVCDVKDVEILRALASAPRLDRYREVGIDAAKAFMCRAISESIRAGRQNRLLEECSVKLDSSSARHQPGTQGHSRAMGSFMTQKVMVEWKEYDHRWRGDPGVEIHRTMDALVNLLDPEETPRVGVTRTRILDCVGYFHEERKCRFGFVYPLKRKDGIDNSKLKLFSLNDVIGMTYDEETRHPNLGDIFLLAKELAACIHALHKVGWLHKKISSHHILMFSPTEDDVHEHVAAAVLAGFDDSRPEASSVTLGPRVEHENYQHPFYTQSVGFRKSFDFYSFGIVLLELGIWLRLSAIRDGHRSLDKKKFQEKLLEYYVPQLGERMGSLYRDAVRFCLMAD
ncbi:kinase-like protein, partial [Decorospora gaudefroyi]